MLTVLEIFPLFLNIFITFEFNIAFGILIPVLYIHRYEVGENHGVHTFALILRFYSHQQQVYHVDLAAYGFPQMIPACRKQFASAAAQSLRQRRHTYAHSHQIAIAVHYQAYVLKAYHTQIHVEIIVNLTFGQGRLAVKACIGLVD